MMLSMFAGVTIALRVLVGCACNTFCISTNSNAIENLIDKVLKVTIGEQVGRAGTSKGNKENGRKGNWRLTRLC